MLSKSVLVALVACMIVSFHAGTGEATPVQDNSEITVYPIASSRHGKVDVQLAQSGLLGKDVSVNWWACGFPCNHLGCQNYHNWCVCYSGCVCYCYT